MKISHLRPFGNPCVVYRERGVAGKIQDAGVKGYLLGYGYVHGKKGYRVRIANSNRVVTSVHVSFGAYPENASEVEILQDEKAREIAAGRQSEGRLWPSRSGGQGTGGVAGDWHGVEAADSSMSGGRASVESRRRRSDCRGRAWPRCRHPVLGLVMVAGGSGRVSRGGARITKHCRLQQGPGCRLRRSAW